MPLINIYLSTLGAIFSIAFLSYYIQYPALSSSSGIEPCHRVFSRAYPELYEKAILVDDGESGYVDIDTFVELVSLIGIGISVVITRCVNT